MATLRDVAKEAGVSVSTVSRILNGKETNIPISDVTRAKVMDAVDKLGYVPNRVARGLVSHRTGAIGILVSNNANPFFADLVRGVENLLAAADYSLLLFNHYEDVEREKKAISQLVGQQVDGVLLNPAKSRPDGAERLISQGIPVVLVARRVTGHRLPAVLAEHAKGVELAVRHLASLGHKRIAMLNGPEGISAFDERRQGFENALEELGLSPADCPVVSGPIQIDTGRKFVYEQLRNGLDVSAVVASCDAVAFGIIDAAKESGISIPQDLSVVGYDDTQLAAMVSPKLTSINQQEYYMGRLAAELLLSRIKKPACVNGGDEEEVVLTPRLVRRDSCSRP